MKRAKRIYLAIIIFCVGILIATVYYLLGGLDKLEVFEFDGINRTVIGKHHIGRFSNSKIRTLFEEAKNLIDSGKLNGKLTMVEYDNDTIGEDSVHLFIGSSFEEIRDILEIPSGFSYEEYRASKKIYRIFITQHPLARPTPEKTQETIEAYAATQGKDLRPYTFDIYYSDGSLFTEKWTN